MVKSLIIGTFSLKQSLLLLRNAQPFALFVVGSQLSLQLSELATFYVFEVTAGRGENLLQSLDLFS